MQYFSIILSLLLELTIMVFLQNIPLHSLQQMNNFVRNWTDTPSPCTEHFTPSLLIKVVQIR